MEVRFTLPVPPSAVVQETWRHPLQRHREKQRYLRNGLAHLQRQLVPIPSFFKAEYTVHFRLKGLHDPDNLVRLLKWPLDLLVHAGLVRDDRETYLHLASPPTQEALPRVRRRKTEDKGEFLKRQWRRDAQVGIAFHLWERGDADA